MPTLWRFPGACARSWTELAPTFPPGISYSVPFDTTLFVSESVHEVVKTLIEAGLLVLLVVFIFLESWRATLIPMLAVPVSLIGAFSAFLALGFSINTLTFLPWCWRSAWSWMTRSWWWRR